MDTVTGRYNSDAADQWLDLVQDSMENRDDESYFERPEVQSRLEKIRDTRNQSIPFVQDIYERSDEAIRKGEEQYAISKVGVDPALSTIMDVGRIGGEMLMDAAFGAVTGGSGTLPMVARSFGGGMYQARAEGADRREAILSGAAQGAVDYATERMFGVALPFARLYGGGSLDDVVQRGIQSAVSRFASTEAGQRALGGGLTVAASALTEGAEEFIADWASWQLPNIIYGGDVASVEETLSNSLYDFMLGSVMGGLGGAVSPSTYNYRLPTGQESAGGVVNSDTTMAIEAPEAPGSVQNTAQNDSIPEATRRAVDLLVSGQEISGNQATRIARDPEALSLLGQLTGTEVNTDAPLSRVKADIRAVAGTRAASGGVSSQGQASTQTERTAAQRAYDVDRVRGAASSTGMGENGQRAISAAYDGSVDADRYYAGFTAYYEAGLSGRAQEQVRSDYAADLTEAQRFAAYTAGQNDAAASLQREKLAAQFAQTAGEDSGLVYDDFVWEAVESGRTVSGEKGSGPAYLTQETAERVNSVAKALGLRVRFVDQVDGGRANAEITGSEVQIEKNNPLPVQFLMGHEVTHRLQELAPEEYRAFREAAAQDEMVQAYVRRYTEGDTGLTYEQALDEAAADYAGRMLEDGALLDQFLERNQDNRTLLEKIRDAIRTLVRKLTGAEKKAAQTAEGKLSAALEAGAKRAETLRERQGDGTMDTTRNSLKEDGEYGRTREETGAEFERRCLEEGYQVLAGADTRYGYRGVRSAGEAARQVQTELERLGVPCFVKEGAVLKNNGTTTVVLKSPQATTLSVGRIAIDNSITLPPKNVAGHEAFHFWKGLDGRESYTETVLENLDFTSEAFQKYQSSISRVMFQGEVDLSNQGQFDQLMEEILAYLSGDIHEGTNEDALRPMFRDFDAVRTAWETLVEENRSGTTRSRYSLKEDRDHGRAREETREEFRRRCLEEGYQFLEKAGVGYGFRRAGQPDDGGTGEQTSRGAQTQQEMTLLGIPADVIDGPILRNRNGFTDMREVEQAVTVARSHVFISKNTTLSPRNIAGHEAFHLWKSGTGRDTYIETLEDNLQFSSEAFREYQSDIALTIFGQEADLTSPENTDKLFEELFAYISGDIHEGTNEAALRPMFRDFDAVRAAWEQLVEENRGGTTRSKYSLKEDGDHGRTREETRGAFLRRAAGAGYAVYEGETAGAYGYRRVDRESARENAGQIQAEISNLGIKADIISGPILINRNGKTIERPVSHAVTIDRARILVNENSTLPPRNVAGHEAFHLWKSGVGRDAYIETVEDNLDFTSDDFRNYQSAVSYTLFGEEADLNDDRQMARLREELFAYISGDIHEGANEANLRPMFRDFDAVRTAWETLVEENRSAQARESRKGFSVDRELDQEIRQIVKEAREGGRSETEVRRAIRDTMDRALERQKEQQRATQRAARGRRSARELRERIERHVAKLSKNLRKPTDKQHIPEQLRTAVAAMLDAINLESVYTVDPETGKRRKGGEGDPTKRTEAFRQLRQAYSEITKDGADYTLVIDPDLMDNLDELAAMRNIPLAEMSIPQLTTVWDTVKAVEASVRTANKMLGQSRFQTISQVANGLKDDNILRQDRGDFKGILGRVDKLVNMDMLTPQSYFHRLGQTGDEMFRMLRTAQDRQIQIMHDAEQTTRDIIGKTDINKLERETHTFQVDGGTVTLSTAQIMSLYELMKREQAQEHIFTGGIRPETIPGQRGLRESRRSAPAHVTAENLAEMVGTLTDEQVEMADKLQQYMGGRLSELGNEASMEVYGYRKFTEPHYFPIQVDRNQTQRDISKEVQAQTIAGRGFTKSTAPRANNAVMVNSIFDVYASHVNDMATYAAWLPTMENVRRIRDFTFRDGEGNRTGTVKDIIERVFGRNGNPYLNKLVDDLNQGVRSTADPGLMDRIVGNYKAASVSANLRVILQQPTAILRALNTLDAKYLLAGTVKRGDWQKVKQYAPIAQWKDWGYFDINTGRQMKDVLFDSDTRLERLRQAGMAGASAADSFTWARLWNAVEAETKDRRKDLKPGTKEFYQAVGQRFSEIVDQTQVVDGVLQRSHIMRSPDGLTKMTTSFMGEPTKSYNMFLNAVYDLRHATGKESRRTARRALARTSVALAVSFTINAVMQSLVDGLRDDDKELDYWERVQRAFIGISGDEESFLDYWNSFWSGNLEASYNPLSYMPYFKDLVSIIQGYDVSRMDAEALEKVFTSGKNFWQALNGEGRYSLAGASASFLAELSRLFGLPVANLKRDIQGTVTSAAIETDDYWMQYQIDKALLNIGYSGNRSGFMDILYQASVNDPEAYELIYDDMIASGITQEQIRTSMETRMREAQGVESVADLTRRYLTPDQERTYNRIYSQVTSSAIWSAANEEQREAVEDDLYDLAAGTDAGQRLQEKINGGASYGISDGDYLLYLAAREIADAANEDPEKRNGSIDQSEAEAAIDMLTGLSNEARAYLWQSTNKGWSEKNNPYR